MIQIALQMRTCWGLLWMLLSLRVQGNQRPLQRCVLTPQPWDTQQPSAEGMSKKCITWLWAWGWGGHQRRHTVPCSQEQSYDTILVEGARTGVCWGRGSNTHTHSWVSVHHTCKESERSFPLKPNCASADQRDSVRQKRETPPTPHVMKSLGADPRAAWQSLCRGR